MGMRHAGYNLFAFGPTGTGKYDFVRSYAERIAAGWEAPPDWCYVNNFAEPHKPRAIRLPPGEARPCHDDIEQLIDELRHAIPAAFESEEYRNRKNVIQEQFKERQEERFNALQARARERDVALIRTPMGLALAPIQDGEVLRPKEFEQLSAGGEAQARVGLRGAAEGARGVPGRDPGLGEGAARADQDPQPRDHHVRRRPPDRRAEEAAGPTSPPSSPTSTRCATTSSTTSTTSCRRSRAGRSSCWPRRAAVGRRPDPFRRYRVNVLVEQPSAARAPDPRRARRSSTRTTRPSPTWSAGSSTWRSSARWSPTSP